MSTLETYEEKLECLRERLSGRGCVAVAFSGGVDSTLLLTVAREVAGEKAVALMAVSALTPAFEVADAERVCEELGARLVSVEADPLSIPEVRSNARDRCYHCKHDLFSRLKAAASDVGADVLMDGTNVDDAQDYRPGEKALQELGVESPLRDCGFTKQDVRKALRSLGSPLWAKPSCACLATRIPYGEALDERELSRIDEAEGFLRGLGFEEVRVRLHGDIARIEVSTMGLTRLGEPSTRMEVVEGMKRLGFRYVCADLEGFRSGNMNAGA